MARKTVEQRMQALEDIQAIANLKARYFEAANGGWDGKLSHDGKKVAAMFVKDGTWETVGYPGGKGQAGIIRQFALFQKQVPIAVHISANPNIRVDGDTGVGEWHMTCIFNDPDGRDYMTTLIYEDHFVRTAKGWKFKSLLAKPFLWGPYMDGWTRQVANVKPTKKSAARKKT